MSTKTKTKTALAIATLAGLACLFGASDTAHALRIGGHAALHDSTHAACTSRSYAALANNCGNTVTHTIPLIVESSGSKALSFRGKGATSDNDVECRGQAMTDNNSGYWSTGWTGMPAFGNVEDVSMGNLYVGEEGAAYMRCKIDDGASLLSVEWEQ